MNWNTLNYVVEIAEEGSFSKAAQKLYIAQPSLSQSIQALEKELGSKLFDRSRSPVELTYAGELFVSWAKDALRTREDTMRQITDVANGEKTKLVVGVSLSRSAYLFPEIMAKFRKLRPNCSVSLIEKPSNLLSQEKNIDILIDIPHDEDMLNTSTLVAEERIMLAVPENILFTPCGYEDEYPVINISDISDSPFIVLSEDQMLRKVFDSICAKEQISPEIALECRSIQTAYSMVKAGIGAAIVPELFIRNVSDNKVSHCIIKNHCISRKIAISHRNDRYLTKDAQIFTELLKEML